MCEAPVHKNKALANITTCKLGTICSSLSLSQMGVWLLMFL